MKIHHIYITKEGEPMANPYQDAPQFSAWDMLSPATPTDKLIKEYHSGLLPFEDRELALMCVPSKNRIYSHGQIAGYSVKPDTIIPVDIEVGVVGQFKVKDGWEDMMPSIVGAYDFNNNPKLRKVLRIKP